MIEPPLKRIYRRLFKPAPWHLWRSSARALPDFILIGAMRSGTTALHDFICRSPAVFPAIKKEVHYFDLNFERGESWYRAHFPYSAALERNGRRTGEASPYYLSHPLAPQRAASTVPGAQLVAVLRDPVERAYSHYWHSVRLGIEDLSFEEALDREAERLQGEEARIRSQPGYASRAHQHLAYTTRSLYARELARWLANFPGEQLLVLESETLQRDFERQAVRLMDFLGLPPAAGLKPRPLNRAHYPPMAPAARERLQAFFRPNNEELFDLIGGRFDW